jgi:hypothetical protein
MRCDCENPVSPLRRDFCCRVRKPRHVMLFTNRAMWFVPRTRIPTARSQPVKAAGDMEHVTVVRLGLPTRSSATALWAPKFTNLNGHAEI